MLLLFAQMKLLATPLLALPTSLGFGESYDEDVAREQLVVLRPRDAPNVDWKRIDERMIDIVCPVQGLYIMKVPTFKAGLVGKKLWKHLFFLIAHIYILRK